MNVEVTSKPLFPAITLDEARKQVRASGSAEDDLLTSYVETATSFVETRLARRLITQTVRVTFERFPSGHIVLADGPAQSITTVEYQVDLSGSWTTFPASGTDYSLHNPHPNRNGRVVLDSDASWPSDTLIPAGGMRVTTVVGYGDSPADIPEAIRHALKVLVAEYHTYRDNTRSTGTVPGKAVEDLIAPFAIES